MNDLARLSRRRLREITGTPIKARQIKWLAARGWPHDVDVKGYPIVLTSVAVRKLAGETTPEPWTMDDRSVA